MNDKTCCVELEDGNLCGDTAVELVMLGVKGYTVHVPVCLRCKRLLSAPEPRRERRDDSLFGSIFGPWSRR